MSTSPPTSPPNPAIGTRGPGGGRGPGPAGPPRTAPPPALVPGARRQRRWSLALLAVLITLGSALGFVVLWMNAGGREPVLVMKNEVLAGQIIESDDLSVVRMAADPGVKLVSSSARDDVVGQPAAVDLLAGQALVADAIGEADEADPNAATVAIPVAKEELVALERGDHVTILGGVPEGETEAELIGNGRVVSIGDSDETSSEVRVEVDTNVQLLPAIGAAIQQDNISLAKTSGQD